MLLRDRLCHAGRCRFRPPTSNSAGPGRRDLLVIVKAFGLNAPRARRTYPASMPRNHEDAGDAASSLSKVPQVTLAFWVVKILATTLGETGGDALSMTLKL